MKVVTGKGNLINNSLLVPLKCIIDLSLISGTFPEKIKIALLSVLLCFSKMLEMIMYNRLYISLKTIYYTIRSLDCK